MQRQALLNNYTKIKNNVIITAHTILFYLKLILSDPVESEIFIVDGIKSAAEDAGLDFVILIRKELELDVRIARADV